MRCIQYPKKEIWSDLIKRPLLENVQITQSVNVILDNVRINGDTALYQYAKKYDQVTLDNLTVSKEEIDLAELRISGKLKTAIQTAYNNIYAFHKAQQTNDSTLETMPGVKCWRKNVPIDKVGLYIPGGSAPLFSTILMLGIPAKLAGCKEVVLCTPTNKDATINPAILFTAKLVGITQIFKIGGAQAIGAMAFGTESIPNVYKIFGPGNQYVTKAKELVQQKGIAIDMPAGPSEVLVIADKTSRPQFVASDLLSQAEHGIDSQVILLSNSKTVIDQVLLEIEKQTAALPRKEMIQKTLENSNAILLNDLETCIAFSNSYAPEHLIIASDNANVYIDKITNAGSVFLGNFSCESAGDYASGTNHTLPTNGYAKNYSGVSLDSFVKKITFQELNAQGIKNIGNVVETMAEAEGLLAHKNAMTLRLKAVKDYEN